MKVEIAKIERNETIGEKVKQKMWYELTLAEIKYHSGYNVNLNLKQEELELLKTKINEII